MIVAVIKDTLRESISRRMGVVLLAFAAIVPTILLSLIRVQHVANGKIEVAMLDFHSLPPEIFALSTFMGLLSTANGFWVILGVFAVAPLLMSFLEKGRADLVVSKGTPRWQIFLGHYLGAYALYLGTVFLMAVVPALYLWARTGVSIRQFLIAICISVFTFATVLAFGWLLLLSGVIALVHAFRTRTWSGFFLYLLSALLRGFTGYLLVRYPLASKLHAPVAGSYHRALL